MSDTLTTNEVADLLETDPKTLRKFFRSDSCDIEPVGQGKRYTLDEGDVDNIRPAFQAWVNGKAKKASAAEVTVDEDETDEPKAKAKPAPKKTRTPRKTKKETTIEELEDEDLSLDDDEPSEDDLLDIEDDLTLED